MVTKGIIEEVINNYSVKVRLPIYDGFDGTQGATLKNNLSEATICSLPNSKNYFQKGDIVYVAFEDDDKGKPVIIGFLQKETGNTSEVGLKVADLTSTSTTKLPYQTSIGEISPLILSYINYLTDYAQNQFDNLTTLNIKNNSLILGNGLILEWGNYIGDEDLNLNATKNINIIYNNKYNNIINIFITPTLNSTSICVKSKDIAKFNVDLLNNNKNLKANEYGFNWFVIGY